MRQTDQDILFLILFFINNNNNNHAALSGHYFQHVDVRFSLICMRIA